jgi:hypothetical protein
MNIDERAVLYLSLFIIATLIILVIGYLTKQQLPSFGLGAIYGVFIVIWLKYLTKK